LALVGVRLTAQLGDGFLALPLHFIVEVAVLGVGEKFLTIY